MSSFDAFLAESLRQIGQQNLLRRLRVVSSPPGARMVMDGRELLQFSSNDYLGLANHPRLKEAAAEAASRYGAGAGASRLISGSLAPFHELEAALAGFKQAQAALVFSTGFAAALGAITALLGRGDFIVLDKRVHASIVDAARLCGAQMRVFAHNDLDDLAEVLRWCQGKRAPGAKVLVVTESVFSMDGDVAPLREIAALKDEHDAWLMVDEAHATGLFGLHRRGFLEEAGLSGRVELQMGTLGKALGASGGFICGSRSLVEFLVNRARSFIFSTAPPAASAAAAGVALEIVASPEGAALLARLRQNLASFGAGLSPIIPVLLGPEAEALRLSARLLEAGIFVPAIRYPTVPRGQARLRISFSASHSASDVQALRAALDSPAG